MSNKHGQARHTYVRTATNTTTRSVLNNQARKGRDGQTSLLCEYAYEREIKKLLNPTIILEVLVSRMVTYGHVGCDKERVLGVETSFFDEARKRRFAMPAVDQ